MNLDDITPQSWILAMFIRDDGERFLLGDGFYEFKDSLQHFQADEIANDVVELQGADGQLLAGQVKRTGNQTFEGYIGDASLTQQQIEQKRQEFLSFFQIRRFYTVVYIMHDGSAIQRKRGYLTELPTVPELWQRFPEYSVTLNFEDTVYYEYAEGEGGEETYAHEVNLALSNVSSGGLVWDNVGAVANPIPLSGSSNIFNYDLPTQGLVYDRFSPTHYSESETQAVIQSIKIAGTTAKYFCVWCDDAEPDAKLKINLINRDGEWLGWSMDGGQSYFNIHPEENIDRLIVFATKDTNAMITNLRVVLTDTLDYDNPPAYEDFIDPTTIDGFVWESGTTGGPTTVSVPGVDSANPVWTVPGQAINPTITNLTTGQSLTWQGTVPNGQTLIVDMNEMTATLEGANVFEFITGTWISLRPGNNRISYTTDNDAPESTLSWNGVAG